MRDQGTLSAADRPARPTRPLTASQESIFFAVIFALGLCLQLAAVLLQTTASG